MRGSRTHCETGGVPRYSLPYHMLSRSSMPVRLATQSPGRLLGRCFRRGSSSGSTVEPSELAPPALRGPAVGWVQLMSRSPVETWSESSGVHGTLHVRVGRAEINEDLKRISPRLSKISNMRTLVTRHSRAVYYNKSHRTRYCAVCASQAQAIDRANRAAHRATLGTAVAAALPAHVLPIARGSGGPGAHMHCHATPLLRHMLLAGTQSERPTARRAAPLCRPITAPRRPPVPCAHCREPWRRATPAAPRCRALAPAHCPP